LKGLVGELMGEGFTFSKISKEILRTGLLAAAWASLINIGMARAHPLCGLPLAFFVNANRLNTM